MTLNNILIGITWIFYFFMICVNVYRPNYETFISYNTFNGIVLLLFSIILLLIIIFNFKKIGSSKIVLLSTLFLGIYYISAFINNNYIFNTEGMLIPIVLFVGVLTAKLICTLEIKNVNKLVTAIASLITIVGLISIDMSSCKVISAYLGIFIKMFTGFDYTKISVFEAGVRMKSIVTNPNVFASLTAISIFLNLYLYEAKYNKIWSLYMLFINMVAFIYAFSLGAGLVLAMCLILYLIVNRKNEFWSKVYLLGATGIMAFICVGIGILGMGKNGFISFVPLIIIPFCCIILKHIMFAKERFLKNVLPTLLQHLCPILVLAAILIFALMSINKPVKFSSESPEKVLSATLKSGDYVLNFLFDREINLDIKVYGQTYNQASRREFDTLKEEVMQGENIKVDITTMDNNKAINMILRVEEEASLLSVNISTPDGKLVKNVPVDILVLPNFIENRLSPFNSNQNAIQRFTFFFDGLKLWRKNVFIGSGPNSFVTKINGIKTSDYSTFSSHNFIIDTLCDTGVIGAGVMIVMLLYAFYLMIKGQRVSDDNVMPMLAITTFYIVCHSMIEVTFIYIPYLLTVGILLGIVAAKAEKVGEQKFFANFNGGLSIVFCILNIVSLLIFVI